MKKIIVPAIFTVLFSGSCLFSQDQNHFSIQHDMGFGTGDLGDFITSPSFRGASAQYRFAVNDNVLVGVDAGWNVFYERRDYDTYSQGSRSISGIQYRYQNEVPVLISADYLISSGNKMQPYIGAGIGTFYTERTVDMNIYRFITDQWQFAMKPEVGLLYELAGGSFIKLTAKYYYGFKTDDLESQGYFTVSLGFAFQL